MLKNRIFLSIVLCVISVTAMATGSHQSAVHQNKYPTYPEINYDKYPNADQIKKGEYLAKMGDCIACHTKPGSDKPFAGGLPIDTPYGTLYTPNITPAGIGKWTNSEFLEAIREGISPQGKYYYPGLPYMYFNKLSDEDALSIRAYLSVLPSIEQKDIAPDMPWPFSWRLLQFFPRLLFFDFDKGHFEKDTAKSAAWNRGAYLVEGLGHCAMCHTPMHYMIFKKYVMGTPIKKYNLTGAFVDGFYAPNISSTGLKDRTIQEIVNVFSKDKLLGGGEVAGPMAVVDHDSLNYLTTEDQEAIATYLKSVKSETPPKPENTNTVSLAEGKTIFSEYCTGCHSTGADGAPVIGNQKDWAPIIKLGLNQLYKNATSGIGNMPPKGTCESCSMAQIQSAVDYMVNASKKGSTVKVESKHVPVSHVPDLTAADGKRLYEQACASCHTSGKDGAPKIGDKAAWQPMVSQGMVLLFSKAIQHYRALPKAEGDAHLTAADIEAAVKYIIQESKIPGDYKLW